MTLEKLDGEFTVCKVASVADVDLSGAFCFVGNTDGEISLVCQTGDAPRQTVSRKEGWKGLRVQGTLDFSLIGVLSRLSGVLADSGVGVFVVSTYDTDYIFVQREDFERAAHALSAAGYAVI